MSIKVFVYGTLKRGGSIRGVQENDPHKKFIGMAVTAQDKYSMMDMGSFPALLFNGEHKVSGEVFEVTPKGLDDFDTIEGYPDFYNRALIDVEGEGKCFVYYIPLFVEDPKTGERVDNLKQHGWDMNPVNEQSPHISLSANTLTYNDPFNDTYLQDYDYESDSEEDI